MSLSADDLTALRAAFERDVPLPDAVWHDLASRWSSVTVARRAFVTQAGDPEPYFYFVREGVQRIYHLHDGQAYILGFSYPPSFSGVYSAFIERQPAEVYLQAITDSRLLRIHRGDFEVLLNQHPLFERWARRFSERILFGRLKREIEMLTMSAEDRYLRLLYESPHVFQLIPQKDLASYLGMTPETFSRVRRRLATGA